MRKFKLLMIFWIIMGSNSALAKTNDFADLYEALSPSVVTIHTRGFSSSAAARGNGLGSGVLIDADRIVTAAHVVDSAQLIAVEFSDGQRIPASIITSLESSDIALLKLQQPHPNPVIAPLADSDKTRIGEQVFIIGSPFGISKTLSIGHLSGRMNRGLLAGGTPIEFLQTDTAINTGNSGGPMFNTQGEVIGIVSFILSKSGGFDGIGFATSSNTMQDALLNSSGILAGFEGVMLDEDMARVLNVPQAGLLVQRVVSDSMVDRAGLRAGYVPATITGREMMLGGDVIVEINGLICKNPHDFRQISENSGPLDEENTYSIKVFRQGEIVELIASGDGINMQNQFGVSNN